MSLVLTLVGNPALTLATAEVARAAEALGAAGGRPGEPDWLAPGLACDLAFDGLAQEPAEAALRQAFAGQPLDLAVQAAEGRRKALLIADMDSTIVTSETLDELAGRAGLKDEIAAITARTMAGELDFAQALRARVGRLAGLPATALDETLAEVELTPGARTLVQTMKADGAYCVLVSGGFTHFTGAIRVSCGFDEDHANRLVLEDGQLTGEVEEPILGRDAKLANLKRLARDRGLALGACCAVGDGANDIDMLQAAGLGVAYHGKPAVRAATRAQIDHGDLTALLYFQGYRQDELRD